MDALDLADTPDSSSSFDVSDSGAHAEACAAFAAGQLRRRLTPLLRRREQDRLAREHRDHLQAVATLHDELHRRSLLAAAQDRAQAFKLGPLFQTCNGSNGVAAKLVPLHSLQRSSRTTERSRSGSNDTLPAGTAAPAASPATSAGSTVHSVGSQLALLDEDCSGHSTRSLWSASSYGCWQAISPPATVARVPERATNSRQAHAFEPAALLSPQPASSVGSAGVLVQPTLSFLDFVLGVQQQEEAAGCSSGRTAQAGQAEHASPRPGQSGSPDKLASLASSSSALTVSSHEVLLQQPFEDYSIPVGPSSACSTGSSRRRSWGPKGRPLLSAWRNALQNRLPSRGSILRAGGGRTQAQKGQEGSPAAAAADAAKDVRPKWDAALRRGRWQAQRTSADENEPVVRGGRVH